MANGDNDIVKMLERKRLNCQLSIKALQNIRAAGAMLDRLPLCLDDKSNDDTLVPQALFLSAVVRYARPFTEISTPNGKEKVSVGSLKDVPGFSRQTHDHLIYLRNKLLAHDDIEEVTPKIPFKQKSVRGSKHVVFREAVATNKCLGYPATAASLSLITPHVKAAAIGIAERLDHDLDIFKQAIADNPEAACQLEDYEKPLGECKIPAGGTRVTDGPDISSDPYLELNEPSFDNPSSTYHYEKLTFTKIFKLPGRIELENGESVTFEE